MLYKSTRDENAVFTAARTLTADNCPDGGLYMPFRLPVFSQQQVREFAAESFGETVAKILNLFFNTKLSGWDVDFLVGRSPLKLHSTNHRLVIAELWHNLGNSWDYALQKLYNRISPADTGREATEWAKVSVRVAYLFGIFSRLMREGYASFLRPVDITVPADDFSVPMAAWYAREMGLPMGKIICGCNSNSGLWDLIHRGEFSPAASQEPARTGHERWICCTIGSAEATRYSERCAQGKTYTLEPDAMAHLNDGFYAAVVGDSRITSVMKSVSHSSGYCLGESEALAYAALQDYRAGSGEGRCTLLMGDIMPQETNE